MKPTVPIRPRCLLIVIPALVSGCALFTGPETRLFAAEREYRFDFFETPEECEAHQPPDFFINCFQWIHFFPSGRVEMVVTDIVNPGRYEIREDRVSLIPDPTPELDSRIEFRLSADETSLTDLETGKVWTLWSGT